MRKIFAVLAALICCLSVWTSVPAAQAFTLDKEDGEYSIQVELDSSSYRSNSFHNNRKCSKRRHHSCIP